MTTNVEFPFQGTIHPPAADIHANGSVVTTGPRHRRPDSASRVVGRDGRTAKADPIGQMLIGGACLLLAVLAVAMGITSFHAQFTYIFAAKRQWAPSLLEALGLDAGAVIFSLLGIALARLGRRAAVERVLVVICALGSCGMNVLNANLGSPRSVAVYAMPPVLFALTSDRLIAVVRRSVLGTTADDAAQRSAWHLAGRWLLYGMRFAVDRRGTAAGLRQAILDAAPLSESSRQPANLRGSLVSPTDGISGDDGVDERPRSRPRKDSKTARFLALVQQNHGPLGQLDPADVYRISAELAPRVRLNAGSGRAALRSAVLAAQDGAR